MLFGRCGSAVFMSGGSRILGLRPGKAGEPFVYNCASETREADAGVSDEIVSFAFSPSGTYLAVTADNKQLILFRTRPWECLSVRNAVRRSTSLAITEAEDQILLADKSGDVYSFSIHDPQSPGQLQLGHLSMLLAVAVSPEDRFVITADRDEKIRVSLLEQPHIIEAFCLGHQEFVSELCIPSNHSHLLLSGSGDGTVRLWEYQSGRELDCFNMCDIQASGCQKARCAVVQIVHCRQGDYFGVLCDSDHCLWEEAVPQLTLILQYFFPRWELLKDAVCRIEGVLNDFAHPLQTAISEDYIDWVHILELDAVSRKLSYQQMIRMRHRAWGIAFDDTSGLWILDGEMVVLYQLQEGHWQNILGHPEQQKIQESIRAKWDEFQESATENSYSSLYKMTVDNMAQYQSKKALRICQRHSERTLEMGQLSEHSKRTRV